MTAVPAGDEVVTAIADTAGYHLFAASSGGGWRWQPLATLQPGGYGEERWIGEQCLTGDGRFVVAVVGPWSAQNRPEGIARAGLAYSVDAHTGAVLPLASGLALTYFDPGCGAGSTAALTRSSPDQARTEVLVADAATGVLSSTGVLTGQITSAVPTAGGVLAALGSRLVRAAGGRLTTLAVLPGQVFRLTPNATGGADFLVEADHRPARPGEADDPTTDVYAYDPSGLRRTATGHLSSMRLFPGAGGHPLVVGGSRVAAATSGAGGPQPPLALATRERRPPAGMSLGGQVVVREGGSAGMPVTLARAGDGGAVGGGQPAAARPTVALPADLLPAAAAAATGGLAVATTSWPPSPNTTAPTCAVPRNDPNFQVPQPSSAMIEWATNQAAHGTLTGANATRQNGRNNLYTGAYAPSADFPLHGSFGPSGNHIPREVMDGILAQESNWNHASPHAPPGLAGNPYIADYYGYARAGTIDYNQADCGYGVGQVTDPMRLPAPGAAPSAVQQRIAVDYAEDAAAAAQILTDKWNTLSADGITIDINNPGGLEEWYFVMWAYNSGINPQASTGGTGCNPGPNCTDGSGNWGLGWTNNPANPNYDPARHPFLHTGDGVLVPAVRTYGDAAHPQDWPYQEKVFGWIETPLLEPDGRTNKYLGTFDYVTQTGFFLYRPSTQAFCDSSSNCTPHLLDGAGTCNRSDFHCWWHNSTSICPLSICDGGVDTVADGSPEPTVANPHPPVCSLTLPAGTVVVDEEPSDVNLAGCGSSNWHSAGQFVWEPNTDQKGAATGLIDLHQLGAGFGGRMLFTHTENSQFSQFGGFGSWNPQQDYGVYKVSVFVPDIGAVAQASYVIHPGDGTSSVPVVVNQSLFSDQWVSLGTYYLWPNASVTMSSVMPSGDGATDIAYDAMAFTPVTSYAALGDSYASGEGSGNYDPQTNVSGGNQCHRTPNAYARVYASGSSSFSNGRIAHVACSGAVINNVTTAGQYNEAYQVAELPPNAGLVTIMVGGNDAGFASVLTRCVLPGPPCHTFYTQNDANNEDVLIDSLQPTLVSAYNAIKQRAPHARVLAVTYPSIFQPGSSGGLSCPGIGAVGGDDVEWLIDETFHLDDVVARAAQQAGIGVLDERYAFSGHELCTGSSAWVNSLPIPFPSGSQVTDSSAWFHPTAAGYAQMAKDLAAAAAHLGSSALQAGPLGPAVASFTWLRPLPGVPSAATARTLANALVVTAPSPIPYQTGQFNWPGQILNCSQRDRVLQRDAISFTTAPRPGCAIGTTVSGSWQSPYDNVFVIAATLNDVSNELEPDHVISQRDAWRMGAATWSSDRRSLFGNDIAGLELLTVDNSINASKKNQTVETWVPPNVAFQCTFLEMYASVKYQWNLGVTANEKSRLLTLLGAC